MDRVRCTLGGGLLSVAAIAFALLAFHGVGEAASETPYEQAFERLIADVANPERSFEFVEAAVAAGDLRGAAAALERILLIDPRLANIQLELGVLYLRMGNADLAHFHIREALRATNVPRTVRIRAERLLAVSGEGGARNSFEFYSSLGVRHDSNANAAPRSGTVFAMDPFTLQPRQLALNGGKETDDTAFDASLGTTHRLAFGSRGSSWDTDLGGYAIRYNELETLDQYSLFAQTGPTLVLAGTYDAPVSIRPSVLAGKAWLDGEDYFDYMGGALAFAGFWNSSTVTEMHIAFEDRTFEDSPALTLSDRSGDYWSGLLRQVWQRNRLQLHLGLSAAMADVDSSYQSFDQWGVLAGARWFGTFGSSQRVWSVYANATYRDADYDEADAFVHPTIVREDERLDTTVGGLIGLTPALSLQLDVNYTDNRSTLVNYEYDNVSAGMRLLMRF